MDVGSPKSRSSRVLWSMAQRSAMPSSACMLSRFGLSPTVSNRALSSLQCLASLGMEWHAAKSSRVLKAILSIGWSIKRQRSSHRILARDGWPDYTFSFHDREEIGPRMLARIAKHTGLTLDKL